MSAPGQSRHRSGGVAKYVASQLASRKTGSRLTWILPSIDPCGKAVAPMRAIRESSPRGSGKCLALASRSFSRARRGRGMEARQLASSAGETRAATVTGPRHVRPSGRAATQEGARARPANSAAARASGGIEGGRRSARRCSCRTRSSAALRPGDREPVVPRRPALVGPQQVEKRQPAPSDDGPGEGLRAGSGVGGG